MYKVGSIGITLVAIAPLRVLDNDTSEQVSQILAGEHVEILEKGRGEWVKVRLLVDMYTGWADGRQFDFNTEPTSDSRMLNSPMSRWRDVSSGYELWLPAGSLLTLHKNGDYRLSGSVLIPNDLAQPLGEKCVSLSQSALNFLKAPYQWGGRTVSGIDCSGLSQIVALLHGIDIPRDASQQVKSGVAVDWEMRSENDLAFFENKKGAITHVGILTSKDSIIHASGFVREDPITADGIFNVKEDRITHKLTCLRRLK
jgi:hypothetical protein